MSFLFCKAKEIMLGRHTLTAGETIVISLSASIYAMLVKSSYTPDQDASSTTSLQLLFTNRAENTDNGWVSTTADALLSSNEISSSSGVTFFDAGASIFNSVSTGTIIHGICLYQRITDDADSLPVAFINISTVTANGATINVNWDNGVNRIFSLT
jgi:SNF family Na+-dependent transporter